MTHSDYTALVNTVKAHDYHYFVENSPIISDEEYDRLFFQLQDYEQQNPTMVLPDSPTQYAHGEVKNGHMQVRRRTPMLSTQKAQTIEAVEKWLVSTSKTLMKGIKVSELSDSRKIGGYSKYGKTEPLFTLEPKYDGVSASIIYQGGKLIEASYGKGIEGNDCLRHILCIAGIPHEISVKGRVEVRGEVVCPFVELAKTGYKNCRCAASGILADTTASADMIAYLDFHPYWTDLDLSKIDGLEAYYTINNLRRKIDYLGKHEHFMCWEAIGWCEATGVFPEMKADEIAGELERFEQNRSKMAYPIDGVVIKVADMDAWESLGATAHHPKYSIAYKFAAETAETTVTRIEITTGKTGKRTPVAYFEPVVINGATYQKASVGSEAKLAELGIEVGSKVVVSLRNDVIPHIERSLTKPSFSENSESVASRPIPQEGRMSNTPPPFIGNDESGENFENPNPEMEIENENRKNNSCHSCNSWLKKTGKMAGTMCVGALAIAGAATLLYCCVGLIFFLPLVLAKR